jgi:hypothetical protein
MRPSDGRTRQGAAPPYFGQWESPRRIRGFLAGRDAAQDPLWPASGAETAAEYALWADHLCGMACLKMALGARGQCVLLEQKVNIEADGKAPTQYIVGGAVSGVVLILLLWLLAYQTRVHKEQAKRFF